MSAIFNTNLTCTFQNIGVRCSRGLPFGFMCKEHARSLFKLCLVESTMISYTGSREKRIYLKLSGYNQDIGVLPFPFQLENDGTVETIANVGNVIQNATFCLDAQLAEQLIYQLASQSNLTRDEENKFINIMKGILAPGQGFFYNACNNLSNFVEYARELDKIKYRTSSCYIRFDEQGGADRFVPMNSFPAFYQGIFYNMEMSQILTPLGTSELNYSVYYSNEDKKFRAKLTEPFYICRDDATDGTPLVLDGFRISQISDPYNIPNQESMRYIGFNNIQPLCNQSVVGERLNVVA